MCAACWKAKGTCRFPLNSCSILHAQDESSGSELGSTVAVYLCRGCYFTKLSCEVPGAGCSDGAQGSDDDMSHVDNPVESDGGLSITFDEAAITQGVVDAAEAGTARDSTASKACGPE